MRSDGGWMSFVGNALLAINLEVAAGRPPIFVQCFAAYVGFHMSNYGWCPNVGSMICCTPPSIPVFAVPEV